MRTRTRPAAGFSLLELTIVIGIILLLAALVVAVSTAVIASNEKRNTQNTLAILDAAMKEWERQVDRPVTFQNATGETGSWDIVLDPTVAQLGIPPAVTAYNGTGDLQKHRRRTVALIELIARQPDVETVLARLPEDSLRRVRTATNPVQYSNSKEAIDAWGNTIIAILPGRAFRTGDTGNADLDGSIRTVSENASPRTCQNRQVLFVSAGPDGAFVDVSTTGGVDESADNIYSYGEEGQ